MTGTDRDNTPDNICPEVCLASGSPRRRELLDQLGVLYSVLPTSVDEVVHPGELAIDYVPRVAMAKARAGWQRSQELAGLPVLAADTAVVVNEMILGKPDGREDATAMLRQLSGTSHQVLSAVAVTLVVALLVIVNL